MEYALPTVNGRRTAKDMIIKQKLANLAKLDSITVVLVRFACREIQTVYHMAVKVAYLVGKVLEK